MCLSLHSCRLWGAVVMAAATLGCGQSNPADGSDLPPPPALGQYDLVFIAPYFTGDLFGTINLKVPLRLTIERATASMIWGTAAREEEGLGPAPFRLGFAVADTFHVEVDVTPATGSAIVAELRIVFRPGLGCDASLRSPGQTTSATSCEIVRLGAPGGGG